MQSYYVNSTAVLSWRIMDIYYKEKIIVISILSLSFCGWQVDYSGFMTINPQRFGQKYVGKVLESPAMLN